MYQIFTFPTSGLCSFNTSALVVCGVGVMDVCRQQVLAGESGATVEGTLVFFSLNSSHLWG